MAVEIEKTAPPEPVGNLPATKNRHRVANALAEAYQAINDQSSIVTQVCNVAVGVFDGKPIEKHDMDAIVNNVAEKRKWSDSSKPVRLSEMRAILSTYDRLPKAVEFYRSKSDSDKFTWHQAVTLARALRQHESVEVAVDKVLKAVADKPDGLVRRTLVLTTDEAKQLSEAIKIAKVEGHTDNADAALALIVKWYVESHTTAMAA